MRQRYSTLLGAATARINGQMFVHTGDSGRIVPADMPTLRRVRDNQLPNDPHAENMDVMGRLGAHSQQDSI